MARAVRWRIYCLLSLVAQMVKNLPANAGNVGWIPGSGRSPGGGNRNPLQYSCPGNPMDRGDNKEKNLMCVICLKISHQQKSNRCQCGKVLITVF